MRRIALLLAVGLAFCSAVARAAGDWEVATPERVVAFGDVHGAFEDWTGLLRELGVIDADNNGEVDFFEFQLLFWKLQHLFVYHDSPFFSSVQRFEYPSRANSAFVPVSN